MQKGYMSQDKKFPQIFEFHPAEVMGTRALSLARTIMERTEGDHDMQGNTVRAQTDT